MKRKPKTFIFFIAVGIVLIGLLALWSVSESKASYSTPQEALLAENEQTILIPAYITPKEALFFFIEGENKLGAVKVEKGLFGWKSGLKTWSQMEGLTSEEKINGYLVHEGNVIFGLMKNGIEHTIMVDDIPSIKLDLEIMLYGETDQVDLENLYLWYYEADDLSNIDELRLFNENTNEEINTFSF